MRNADDIAPEDRDIVEERSSFGLSTCISVLPKAWRNIVSNSVRFLAEPEVASDWIRFCDTDILYVKSIRSYFKKAIKEDARYVNIYRQGRYGQALSGVQFLSRS